MQKRQTEVLLGAQPKRARVQDDLATAFEAEALHLSREASGDVGVTSDRRRGLEQAADGLPLGVSAELREPVVDRLRCDEEAACGLVDGEQEAPHVENDRARWMDPRVGQFAGMDPWKGDSFEPTTLHRYQYAGADPANKTDPTGLFLAVTLSVAAISNTINAISLPLLSSLKLPTRYRWISFTWENEFTTVQAGSSRVKLEQGEIEVLKAFTNVTLGLAFAGLAVGVSQGGGTNRMIVNDSRPTGDHAGETPPGAPLAKIPTSWINYNTVSALAWNHRPAGATRQELVAAIGRGIGATAAHEFAHQNRIIIDGSEEGTYDYKTADQKAAYWGQLKWSTEAGRKLRELLTP